MCKDWTYLITGIHQIWTNITVDWEYHNTPLLPYIPIPHQNNEVLHSLNSVVELDSPPPRKSKNCEKFRKIAGEVESIPGPPKCNELVERLIHYTMAPSKIRVYFFYLIFLKLSLISYSWKVLCANCKGVRFSFTVLRWRNKIRFSTSRYISQLTIILQIKSWKKFLEKIKQVLF